MATASLYEPNELLERQVLWGLLHVRAFIKRFVEHGHDESIFFSQKAVAYRWIAQRVRLHYERYRDLLPKEQLLEDVEKHAREKGKDHELALAGFRRDISQISHSEVKPAVLRRKLDDLIALFKNFALLQEARELKRYYECRLEHLRHEACKKCPVFADCKSLSRSKRSFEDKLLFLMQGRFRRIQEKAGSEKIERIQIEERWNQTFDDYKEREERYGETQGAPVGIPTPWPTVTKYTQGWKPGCVYFHLAQRKVGKTTLLLMDARKAVDCGYPVLFLFMENTAREMMDLFCIQAAGISRSRFEQGCLLHEEKMKLEAVREQYRQGWADGSKGKLKLIHRPLRKLGIADVEAEYEAMSASGTPPALVLFDHLHAARLDRLDGDTKPERILAFVEGMCALADANRFSAICAGQIKTSGDRKDQTRWSDELEDPVTGSWKLRKKDDGLVLDTSAARGFVEFHVDLEDRKDQVLLPEVESIVDDGDDLDLDGLSGEDFF